MIAGLSFDYTHARCAARLAWRPTARQWQQLHSARSVAALLDAARALPVGAYLTGVNLPATLDDIDRGFHAQLRARIAEVADWAPETWRAALLWTEHLIDLPALYALWHELSPPGWLAQEPAWAALAALPREARRDALLASDWAPWAQRLAAPPARPRHGFRKGTPPVLPLLLLHWLDGWRERWPALASAERDALERLIALVQQHRQRFARLAPAAVAGARRAFDTRITALLRAHPAEPVSPFAFLLLVALDLEQLRSEAIAHLRAEPMAMQPLAEAA